MNGGTQQLVNKRHIGYKWVCFTMQPDAAALEAAAGRGVAEKAPNRAQSLPRVDTKPRVGPRVHGKKQKVVWKLHIHVEVLFFSFPPLLWCRDAAKAAVL